MNNKIFVTIAFNKKIDNIDEFIVSFKNIKYPKNNLYLFIISPFYKVYDKFSEYESVIYIEKRYKDIYEKSYKHFLDSKCDLYFYIDSSVIILDKNIIDILIKYKLDVVSPKIYNKNTSISNEKNKFNSISLIRNKVNINNIKFSVITHGSENKLAILKDYMDINITSDILYPELYDMSNITEWEDKYLHQEFKNFMNGGEISITEPIPYLFEFPLFNERFCKEMIETMEEHNKWSNGGHNDKRLATGYENVPTVDTQFNQIGFEKQWTKIVFNYITKIAEKGFVGSQTSRINMAFVVKYTPEGQTKLRPHNDSSLYSAMVALNQRNKDFEGGGTRFIRYDYKHLTQNPGYCVIFPGRLTHYHEGLETTHGTRYIIVSFID